MLPVNKRLLIKLDEQKTQTEGGVIIPDEAQERAVTGIILARASDCEQIYTHGKRIYLPPYGGIEFNKEERQFIFNEKDILGVNE